MSYEEALEWLSENNAEWHEDVAGVVVSFVFNGEVIHVFAPNLIDTVGKAIKIQEGVRPMRDESIFHNMVPCPVCGYMKSGCICEERVEVKPKAPTFTVAKEPFLSDVAMDNMTTVDKMILITAARAWYMGEELRPPLMAALLKREMERVRKLEEKIEEMENDSV